MRQGRTLRTDVVGRAARAGIIRPVVLAQKAIEGGVIQADALAAGIRLADQVSEGGIFL